MARIVRIYKMVEDNYLFTLRFLDDQLAAGVPTTRPGQFLMLSVPGTGEAPISISSSPSRPGVLELCVRRVGRVTNALYRLKTNDVVGVRGPYGNGFPVEKMAGNDLLLVAGGLGMAPLRSLLWYALDNRDKFNNITLMYGVKSPPQMLFREELAVAGRPHATCSCLLTVDATPRVPGRTTSACCPSCSTTPTSHPPPPTPPSAARRWSTSSCCSACSSWDFRRTGF